MTRKRTEPMSSESTIGVQQSDVIVFPDGLIGCETWRRFVLVRLEDDDLVQLLQCLDEPGVAFLVTDPNLIVSDYQWVLTEADAAKLKLQDPADISIFCSLTVHNDPADITANLLGPLVVNMRTRLGRQVVLSDSNYSTRYRVPRGDEESGPEDGSIAVLKAGSG